MYGSRAVLGRHALFIRLGPNAAEHVAGHIVFVRKVFAAHFLFLVPLLPRLVGFGLLAGRHP